MTLASKLGLNVVAFQKRVNARVAQIHDGARVDREKLNNGDNLKGVAYSKLSVTLPGMRKSIALGSGQYDTAESARVGAVLVLSEQATADISVTGKTDSASVTISGNDAAILTLETYVAAGDISPKAAGLSDDLDAVSGEISADDIDSAEPVELPERESALAN